MFFNMNIIDKRSACSFDKQGFNFAKFRLHNITHEIQYYYCEKIN